MAKDLKEPNDAKINYILSEIKPEDKENLKNVANECKGIYDKTKRTALTVSAILFSLSFFGLFKDTTAFIILIAISIFVGIAIYGAGKTRANSYFKSNVPGKIVKAVFGPNASYRMKAGWTYNYIRSIKLFRTGNIYETKDRISGEVNGVDFTVADVTSGQRTTHTDAKGHTYTTVTYYFQGIVAQYEFNSKRVKGSLEIRENEGGAGSSLIYSRKDNIDFEDIVFNRDFNVYSKDKLQAFYIITPQFIEAFKEIKRRIPGNLIFSIQDGRLIIAINGAHNNFDYSAKAKSAEEMLESLIRELLPYKWFVDILNLDEDFGQKALAEAKAKEQSAKSRNDEEEKDIIDSIKEEF